MCMCVCVCVCVNMMVCVCCYEGGSVCIASMDTDMEQLHLQTVLRLAGMPAGMCLCM